jgi:transposase InsO family protein
MWLSDVEKHPNYKVSKRTKQTVLKEWEHLNVEPLLVEPESPWKNCRNESFTGKLRDGLLNREIFYTLEEAKVLIEEWRKQYNTIRRHSSLGYRPPTPKTLAWSPASVCASGSLDQL